MVGIVRWGASASIRDSCIGGEAQLPALCHSYCMANIGMWRQRGTFCLFSAPSLRPSSRGLPASLPMR